MKKTYNISLGGRVFHLEEDAGNKLQAYIGALEKHYLKEEGGAEIMNDIECRIAELFFEYMQEPGKEVIILTDIERVIQIMGSPDDIIDQDYEEPESTKISRILYRDSDNRILGGVASGIAAYFNISVLFVRLVFVLLAVFYGIIILVYLILWIVIPPALTSRQKLEMKGEKINISNIEKNIKDNIHELKENKKVQEGIKRTTDFVSQTVQATGNVLLRIGKVILKIIAGITFVISLIAIVALVISLISLCWIPDLLSLSALPWFIYTSHTGLFIAALFLTCLTPVILLLWLSSKYLFQFKNRNYFFPITLTVLWIIGIMLLTVLSIVQIRNFSQASRMSTTQALSLSPQQRLVIKIQPEFNGKINWIYSRSGYATDRITGQTLGIPSIHIKDTEEAQPELTLERKAQGASKQEALLNARAIRYNWELRSDTLYLDNYFTLSEQENWRANRLSVCLYLPKGYSIFLDSSLDDYLRGWNLNRTYVVTEDGLEEK